MARPVPRGPRGRPVAFLPALPGEPAAPDSGIHAASDPAFAGRTVALALARREDDRPRRAAVVRELLAQEADGFTPRLRSWARARFGDCFLEELGAAVRDPADLFDEWRHPHALLP